MNLPKVAITIGDPAGIGPEVVYKSLLKRGIVGVFHHVSEQHLSRYIAEFDYRYNNREGLGIAAGVNESKEDTVGTRTQGSAQHAERSIRGSQ